jgi:aerobic-type carbon monoxide dehydrogenase small subunit (CoxS/CutS family)
MSELENLTKRIALTVNGKKVEAEVEARMTLAEFLREELDLTGTKVGCNRGECGSCTVLLDGNPVYSCTVLTANVGGKEVLTIEGLTK